jgi:O-acetyl-ADP-ribose deacetylase (regulator of RNase III)
MAKIELKTGDLFTAGTDALVNTVNCVGIMGRGVALQFKKAYPANFRAYEAACKVGDVQPGRMFVFETGKFAPRFIINFPTKRHWRGKSRIEDIESGLAALVREIKVRGIRSIALPPLGSGLGGLDWADVRPRIETALRDIPDLHVVIYEPSGAPEVVKSRDVPKMTPGRASLVVLMHQYLRGLLDPFVTLLEVQKLMYFMQLAGQPLRLEFEKGPYGPYARNLSHVLNKVEGHFVSGYSDGGDQPFKELRIVPGAVDDALSLLAAAPEVEQRFARVAQLVEGFETPFGLELLATVHWVAALEGASTPDEAAVRVHAWNHRKKAFTPRQIQLAYDVLREKGWLGTGGNRPH